MSSARFSKDVTITPFQDGDVSGGRVADYCRVAGFLPGAFPRTWQPFQDVTGCPTRLSRTATVRVEGSRTIRPVLRLVTRVSSPPFEGPDNVFPARFSKNVTITPFQDGDGSGGRVADYCRVAGFLPGGFPGT